MSSESYGKFLNEYMSILFMEEKTKKIIRWAGWTIMALLFLTVVVVILIVITRTNTNF